MMTHTIHTYPMTDDLIARVAEHIHSVCPDSSCDCSRIAVVFPGERPQHFLNRALSNRFRAHFFSPHFFTIDSFIDYLLLKMRPFRRIPELDACYLLFQISRRMAHTLLPGLNFSDFLPWARDVLQVIDQLDIDRVEDERFEHVLRAGISEYTIPDGLRQLLLQIGQLRSGLHESLMQREAFTRGLRYSLASDSIGSIPLDEFDGILFCGFFFLHDSEKQIFRTLSERGKAEFFFQGDMSEWPVLADIASFLKTRIEPDEDVRNATAVERFSLYAGFDSHSQASIVHGLIQEQSHNERKDTVVVLPEPETVIPLLSELSIENNDFNVSMGYPLARSALFSLFELMFLAQDSRRGSRYYARDYLHVLRHPIIKNLLIVTERTLTRAVIHKVEEVLLGIEETDISGSLFIDLHSIEELNDFGRLVCSSPEAGSATSEDVSSVISAIHTLVFYRWQDISSFRSFVRAMEGFIDGLILYKVFQKEYPLVVNIVERILALCETIKDSEYCQETFAPEDIYALFMQILRGEKVAFKGTPLRGMQILGRLETRSLRFKHVIMMDANEGIMPHMKTETPLIPRELLIALGLRRIQCSEEIERYQCMRLVRAADTVSFVYNGSGDQEKSRFIEQLMWQKQLSSGRLLTFPAQKARYRMQVLQSPKKVMKKEYVLSYLKNDFIFSASSINTYIDCPLKFYYQYVLRLKEKDDFLEEPDGAAIGTFIHELLESEFKPFIGNAPRIDDAFKRSFFEAFHTKFDAEFMRQMKSDSFSVREVMLYRLNQFLDFEAKRDVESVLGLETEYAGSLPLGAHSIRLVAKVDRIDRLPGNRILVLDYKTGSKVETPAKIDSLQRLDISNRSDIKKWIRSFQLPLYLYFVMQAYPETSCDAALYQIKSLDLTYLSKKVEEYPFDECMPIFFDALAAIMDELFDRERPFEPDHDAQCDFCTFKGMCQ